MQAWPIIGGVLGTLAVAAWVATALSVIAILRLAPPGQWLRAQFLLGLWQFSRLEALTGAAGRPHFSTYRRFFVAFFVLIVAAMLAGIASMALSRP